MRRSQALFNPALARPLLEPGPPLHGNEGPLMIAVSDRRRGIVECGHTAAVCKTSSGNSTTAAARFSPRNPAGRPSC